MENENANVKSKSKSDIDAVVDIFNSIQILFPKMMSINSNEFMVDKYDVKMTKGNSFKFTITFTTV